MSGKIKKLYKSADKCEYQQNYKAIIESATVYTPEIYTDNSQISPCPYVSGKIQM